MTKQVDTERYTEFVNEVTSNESKFYDACNQNKTFQLLFL